VSRYDSLLLVDPKSTLCDDLLHDLRSWEVALTMGNSRIENVYFVSTE